MTGEIRSSKTSLDTPTKRDCGIHFVYCYDAKGTCEMYKIYDPVNLSVLYVFTDYMMNFSVV